jgi:hypothetical protein
MADPELIRAFEKDLEYWQKTLDDETAKLPTADDSNGTATQYSDREVILRRIDYYKRQINYLKRKIKQIKDADRIAGADASQTADALRSYEKTPNTAVARIPEGSARAAAGHDSAKDGENTAEASPRDSATAAAGGGDVASPSSSTSTAGGHK